MINKLELDNVPPKTLERLTSYKKVVEKMLEEGQVYTYSYEIAKKVGISATTIRKDFSILNITVGSAKRGYELIKLKKVLDDILAVDKHWNVAIVGVGNLGKALMNFNGFTKRGFNVVCGFDIDPMVVNRKINGKEIYHIDEAKKVLEKEKIDIVILCVNSSVAQEVFELFKNLGVQAFLNFTKAIVKNDDSCIFVENVDLVSNLEKLSFFLDKQRCYNG